MNCQLFEQHYLDELDGSLDSPLASALHAHKGGCDACQQMYESARDGLALVRRYMPVHEPSPALDLRIMAAAEDALVKRSSQKLSDKAAGGFFGWLNTLLASPSFRPALAFCAMAMLVGSVYVYQAREHSGLFTNKSSRGVGQLKGTPPSQVHAKSGNVRGLHSPSADKYTKLRARGQGTTRGTSLAPQQPLGVAVPQGTKELYKEGYRGKSKGDTPKKPQTKNPSDLAPTPAVLPRRRITPRRIKRRRPRVKWDAFRRRRRSRPVSQRPRRRLRPKRSKRRRRTRRARRKRTKGWGRKGTQDEPKRLYRKRQDEGKKRPSKRVAVAAKPKLLKKSVLGGGTGAKGKRNRDLLGVDVKRKAKNPPVRVTPSRSAGLAAPAKATTAKRKKRKHSARKIQSGFATPPPPMARQVAPVAPAPPQPAAPAAAPRHYQKAPRPTRQNAQPGSADQDMNNFGSKKVAGQSGRQHKSRRAGRFTSLVIRARNASKRGQSKAAINLYKRALSQTKGSQRAELHLQIGQLYLRRNDMRRARQQFDQAVKVTPTAQRRAVYNRITRLYKWHGKYQNAAKMLRRLKKLYPNRAREYDKALRKLPNTRP